jgi:signal transduction histidine kinase
MSRVTRAASHEDGLANSPLRSLTRRSPAAQHRCDAQHTAALAQTRAALQRSLVERRRLERALVGAVTRERNRIAREIHDTVAQALTGVVVQLRSADLAVADGSLEDARQHLRHAVELARDGLGEARRSVRGLRQSALDESDLCTAAARLMDRMTQQAGVEPVFTVEGEPRQLASDAEAGVLRMIQEGLTNALRHAHATRFAVELMFGRRAVRLSLRDDGRGFDPIQTHDGFGLIGIKERVAALRGRLSIASAVGQGTTIVVVLPYR